MTIFHYLWDLLNVSFISNSLYCRNEGTHFTSQCQLAGFLYASYINKHCYIIDAHF